MRKIPLVDLQAQYATIRDEVDAAMQAVLDQAAFIMGPQVAEFEAAYADYCGTAHCVGVSSGTAALELVLHALNIGPGDEVITVAHTFIATAEAISAVGATPVFVEIDSHTYNMDPAALNAAITPRTQAVMPVHLYGQPAEMGAIGEIADAYGLAVIEDAAQAHGASLHGKRTGQLGHAACFSFYPGKNLGAYGDAGAVVTNDAALAEKVRLLRNHGRRSKYVHEVKGFGERLDTLQAAVLLTKLGHLEAWTAARRRLAQRYHAGLAATGLILPAVAAHAEPVWHLYVVRTPQRDALADYLAAQGIQTGVHYPLPLHLQPAYAELDYGIGSLPVSEQVANDCLSLPIYPEMTDDQQQHVIDAVAAFCAERENAVAHF
jgi:dTDP-4-amino-4,6-dideoxygalactose transaminase